MIFEMIFWICVALLFYIYLGYPLMIWSGAKILGADLPEAQTNQKASITILVPAHNEEAVLEEKLRNLLAMDYPKESYEILVVSDGSTDKTNDITIGYMERYPGRIRLYPVKERRGKTNAINESMPIVESDITVFTDANVMLAPDALDFFNRDFMDSRIGGIAGHLSYTNESVSDAAASNGLYWRYEELIKYSESRLGSIMGADGSIFAIRTKLFSSLPLHVLDDFCTSMGIVLKGFKFRFDRRIKAFEKGAETSAEEFPRKIRISNRSYNSYRYIMPWGKLSWFDKWKFFSHKWLRWHSIGIMIIALISSMVSLIISPSFLMLLSVLGQLIVYGLSFLKHMKPDVSLPLLGTIYYFVSSNFACGIGIVQSFLGTKTFIWNKAASTR